MYGRSRLAAENKIYKGNFKAETLLKMRGNICCLLDVFRDGFVYDRAMDGSLSIKSVLPALFPGNPTLCYHNFEDVHDGGEAVATFLALRGMEKDERDKLRASVLAYCKPDTFAMFFSGRG